MSLPTVSITRTKTRGAAPGLNGGAKGGKTLLLAEADLAEAHSRQMLAAIVAFRDGDFSLRLPTDWAGIDGQIAVAFNQTIAYEARIAAEVGRLSATVGKEGRLKQRMSVPGAIGDWAVKVDSINTLMDDLVRPTAEIARTIGAVAKGDLGQAMELEVDGRVLKGEFLRSAKLVNTMIQQLSVFTSEVTRVAREVGTEGKLGGQAQVKGVSGVWKELTDSVNQMAGNLTAQVRNIAEVMIGVANGDLSKKITVDVRGEILQLKEGTNTMVDQLRSFSSEVTRVAREVGTDGRLGGQAVVPGVAGTWKDLTDSVNAMATNLTTQVRNIATVTTAVARGDLSRKITVDVKGEILELKETINTMVDQLNGFSSEVTRVAREVGTEGKLGGQAVVPGIAGTWKDLTDSVNSMASNLTGQVRNIAGVATAIAKGDLSSKITVEVKGEILALKNTMNTMVDQLNGFAGEVSRVAREVGTEGKLGGQAQVPGVAGTWKDLTDNVNFMASNLTGQVRNIAEVTTAVANGDLSKKITVDVRGEIQELKNTINTMVDQLGGFASEVTRVAREVGTEGALGGQAEGRGVAGIWKDLTDSVNAMATNLTGQVRNIAEVTTAVANGDLSKKITVSVRGEILELKDTINTMVDQLNAFAGEVSRVAREVGTEGRLGGQAAVPGVAGTWKDLTDNVNSMASNLTGQVRNIAEVTTAVANGNLSKKITVTVRGEILELKDTINTMVDQLNAFAGEVSRVAREVGTEGKLGGQADVRGVAGIWKDLTDNVNSMASNLTGQVRNIAEVTIAVANGDLSKKITVDVRGEILQLKETINTMVEQLRSFASEVTRVAREVGTDGKLGGQAQVPGVAGTWKDLTDNVNSMASNLTGQVRNIADVATAIARGDLSRKITVDVKGEILQLKETMNTMVEQLGAFASEVSRVAREVGTEGKLGGQAAVPGVAGTWKDLTDNVNSMASNLTGQVRNIAEVTIAVANGDLSKKITVDVRGEILQLKETINTMVEQLRSFASEVTRVAREVGTEGRLGVQAVVPGVAGTWKDLTDSVNTMGANLTAQVRNIAEVTTAVARGDLNRKITVDVKGEILELKNTINTMVDQLNSFAGEVTRVAREVGTEGKLGGQAEVSGVGGTWKDLTDNVNFMASNLTEQVRGIVKVVTAVANGNLSQRLKVQAKGEVAALADTINNMTDTLATFADQVTNVAREVGVDGRLGGQANVPGAAGTWKDLTGNVNLLAANLTTQVRAIAEVATAVTKGDLTRSIQVETRGEVAELKDNINTMISNLRETTESNREQDWLKTNLAKFTGMLQGQRALKTVSQMLLTELAPLVQAQQGTIYHLAGADGEGDGDVRLRLLSSYAQASGIPLAETIGLGEGLVGQCALEKKGILLTDVAPDFLTISSSLGEARRVSIIVLPVLFEGQTKAVIELATLLQFSPGSLAFLELLTQSIGAVFNTIEATMRTEGLLSQSQQLTVELQSRQSELQETNEQLGTKARLLAEQNAEVERKNTEVEQARHALEEKAAELALTSKYKSEFLANMSHELRTPLNSILILSQHLAGNSAGNLTGKQVEFSRNINSSGSDLLHLINDILDLSKIESGTVTVEVEDIPFHGLRETIERNFRHVAEAKNLPFRVRFAEDLPRSMESDSKRLQQILKNLLSNAVKFTTHGHVEIRVGLSAQGWSPDHPVLKSAPQVLAFAVEDTGIGVAPDKQRLIFEAFQQADAGTSRKYGGTGLGLAISRELAVLLGGEIKISSIHGQGSTFTLFLPLHFAGPDSLRTVVPADRNAPHMLRSDMFNSVTGTREVQVADDRENIDEGDLVLLVIEDDPHYARIVLGMARDRGFKGLVALKGAQGLALARQYRPTAISLDVFLPDMLGWTVLNQLKLDPATRHVPVQIVSVADEDRNHGLSHGAFAYLVKSATSDRLEAALDSIKEFAVPRTKRLLVVEDNDIEREAIIGLLGHTDIDIVAVATGTEALQAMREQSFDCMVLDLRLPDMSGFELLKRVHAEPALAEIPVVVFTGKDLSANERTKLQALAKSIVLKDVQSPERLLDETALFLHRVVTDLPADKQVMLQRLHGSNESLRGRKVLVVDDDARNIFALTSLLENEEMQVISAINGRSAIDLIQNTPNLSLVLMDIMMPDMDGYETMREIRGMPEFRNLPILALTAKAMKGDREKCLDAGASDYIAKPVNTDQLLSLMRVWLFR